MGLGSKILATLKKWTEATVKTILDTIFLPIRNFIEDLFRRWDKLLQIGSYPGERTAIKLGYGKLVTDMYWEDFKSLDPVSKVICFIPYLFIWLGSIILNLNDVIGVEVRRRLLRDTQYNYLSVQEAIRAYHRGNITLNEMLSLAHDNGYTSENAHILDSINRPLLDVNSIQDLYLRGEISEANFKRYLSFYGYSPNDIQNIQKLAYYIPPPQDIIRMAVREVFSPAIAQKYGQYEDFPAEFVKYAKMRGISEKWAKNYWAAHWDLPSLTMGYEMLHRGIIDLKDLNTLMRAQDIMPYWRDKLIKISYAPYTRVDTRRMAELGILNPSEVKRAYMDLGYDAEHAENLTKFTLLSTVEKERDLTKTDILNSFEKGIFNEKQTHNLLVKMGYSDFEINVYIARTIQKKNEKYKKEIINAVKTRFERGIINENEVISRLSAVNLSSTEIQDYIKLWQRTRGRNVFSPPLGDLRNFLRLGIISEDTFRKEMIKKGTSATYIDWYIAEAKRKGR